MDRAISRLGLVAALGLLLAGCATSEQLAARNTQRCADRGYQPNTSDFANCVTQLENDRDARMEMRRREMLEKPYIPPTR